MKPRKGLDAALARARHLLRLYDLLCDQRKRNIRKDWAKRFKKFMGWPQSERIVRVDGRDSLVILRESAGISRSHFSHDFLSEILRSAVVAGVSALDRYCHDLIVEKSWKLLSRKEEDVPKALAQLGLSALSARKALRRLRQNPRARPGNIVKKAVQDTLHRQFTFQGPNQITEVSKLLGISDFWNQVASRMPGTPSPADVQGTLTEIVKRRNQIVHEADLVLKTRGRRPGLRDITRRQAGEWIEWIDAFTKAIHSVVDENV